MHAFVDVPSEQADAARAFWSALTGWPVGKPWRGHPEFTSLEPPAGTPYRSAFPSSANAAAHRCD